ncbi:MAG: hypothetical protein JW861_05645 [Bacteroidales bacterium]|nr:hypothetical protein [Bacteroidales bacterium]
MKKRKIFYTKRELRNHPENKALINAKKVLDQIANDPSNPPRYKERVDRLIQDISALIKGRIENVTVYVNGYLYPED